MQRGRGGATAARRRAPPEGVFCNYSHRVCMQNRMDGHDYCMRHMLEDKASPYRQCNYTSTRTSKRCMNAAPKADKKEGYCPEHCKLMMAYRYKMCQKQRAKGSAESLINELSHYATDKEDNGNKDTKAIGQGTASKALEYGSSDESEGEALRVEQAWCGDVESDAESVDSEQEDLLKHAGVYTSDEVAIITRDKLIRLQSLYIEQFKRLQHVMRERRRAYLHTSRHDRDLVSISSYKKDPRSRQNYFKLLALRKYHQRHGTEALLHHQSKERRIAVSESFNYRPPLFARCIEMTCGVKCTSRVLPLSKYCLQHITSDHNQVLYHPCSFSDCTHPVMETSSDLVCLYHTSLLPPALLPQIDPPRANAQDVKSPIAGQDGAVDTQVPTSQGVSPPEASMEDTDDMMGSFLDPLVLDHMTWGVSDSSLLSTISRLASSLGPLATLPTPASGSGTSLDTSANQQQQP